MINLFSSLFYEEFLLNQQKTSSMDMSKKVVQLLSNYRSIFFLTVCSSIHGYVIIDLSLKIYTNLSWTYCIVICIFLLVSVQLYCICKSNTYYSVFVYLNLYTSIYVCRYIQYRTNTVHDILFRFSDFFPINCPFLPFFSYFLSLILSLSSIISF